MFTQNCPKCNKKIKKNFDFCPHCSHNLKANPNPEDYGMLGKNDFEEMASLGNPFLDKVLTSTLKMLEKQIKHLPDLNQPRPQNKPQSNLNVQFFVNGKKVMPNNSAMPRHIKTCQHQQHRPQQIIQKDKLEQFSKLPKEEPISKIRRLSGKVIYELETPGVENIEDVLINQLENSIEIKALSKEKVYLKNLNINLPILRYYLLKEMLVLEFQGK